MPKKQDDWNRCAVCTKPIAPSQLMCRRHWRLVPEQLQRDVVVAFKACKGTPDLVRASNLTHAYFKARANAIESVHSHVAIHKHVRRLMARAISSINPTGAPHAHHD